MEANTHTSFWRGFLSPPSAFSTTTTSSSPPAPASPRERFSSTHTCLLHFEAAPGVLYRPASSLGNVVRGGGHGGASGCGMDYKPQNPSGSRIGSK